MSGPPQLNPRKNHATGMEREPDLTGAARAALGGLAVLVVVVLHIGAWFALMLSRPVGGVHQTTIWTFLFFLPEALGAGGVIAARAVRIYRRRLFAAALVAPF